MTNTLSGQVLRVTNSFVEVASHLNVRQQDESFIPADPSLQITDKGAECQNTGHHVTLAADIHTAGAVAIESERQTFRAHPLCVGYWDPVDGRNVILGEVQSSIGWLTASNEVVYSNCFKGLRASIRIRNSRSGVSQELILHEQPPFTPEMLGMSSYARLELFSEILADVVWPQISDRTLSSEKESEQRKVMIEPEFTDSTLTFGGGLRMGPGRAFDLQEPHGRTAPVGKKLLDVKGRRVLIEGVEVRRVQNLLGKLPARKMSTNAALSTIASNLMANATSRVLVGAPPAGISKSRIQVRHGEPLQAAVTRDPAMILDYETVYGSLPAMTFSEGVTYFISDNTSIDDAVFMGGAVLKYNQGAGMSVNQSLTMKATAVRPVVFTDRDDNTVGQPLDGGPPTTLYAWPALAINCPASSVNDLKHFRINKAGEGIRFNGAGTYTVTHAQIVDTLMPLYGDNNSIILRNALLHGVDEVFEGNYISATAEYVTAHLLFDFGRIPANTTVRNSLVIGVQDEKTDYILQNTIWAIEDMPIFQTMAAGAHYLTDDTYRTGANPALIADQDFLKEIKRGTTKPPMEISGWYSEDVTLSPRGLEDRFGVSHGYHYPTTDYLLRAIILNSTLLITGGCQVATFGPYDMWLSHSALVSEGKPERPNRFYRYSCVQEQAMMYGGVGDSVAINTWTDPENPEPRSKLSFRFTQYERPGRHTYVIYSSGDFDVQRIDVTDSQFCGAVWNIECTPGRSSVVTLTNNLFEGTELDVYDYCGSLDASYYNNTFTNCIVILSHYGLQPWRIFDNVFADGLVFADELIYHDNNAYAGSAQPIPGEEGNFIGAGIGYIAGPLGDFYLPPGDTHLINKGSRSAIDARMFAHTMTGTSRDSETVDIGFHYPFAAAPRVDAGVDRAIILPGNEVSTFLTGHVHSAVVGKIVAANDEWTFSNEGFGKGNRPLTTQPARSTSASQFAKNLGKSFVGSAPSQFLVFSPNSSSFAEQLRGVLASHTWTYKSGLTEFTLETLLGYDALFLAGDVIVGEANSQVSRGQQYGSMLRDYVSAGRSVYVAGGTLGGPANAPYGTAAALWNPFLASFGLAFSDQPNDIYEFSPLHPDLIPLHPIVEGLIYADNSSTLFETVKRLYEYNGNTVAKTESAGPETQLYSFSGYQGMFGTYEPAIPFDWMQVSGPAPAQLLNPDSATPEVRFPIGGTYEFRLTGDYGGQIASDTVLVHVIAAPRIETVWATPSEITFPNETSVTLNAVVMDDDNLPLNRTLIMSWEVSGPSGVRIQQNSSAQPLATAYFEKPGENDDAYVFTLKVSDGLLSASKSLTLNVHPGSGPPTVDAGPDQTVILGDVVYLPGIVTDDGYPKDGQGDYHLTIGWSPINGVKFHDPNNADTVAEFFAPGTYVMTLNANDTATAVSDPVTIVVKAPGARRNFKDADYLTAAIGGIHGEFWNDGWVIHEEAGTGRINLPSIDGTVYKAYLFWHGPSDSVDPNANAGATLQGRYIRGTRLADSGANGWDYSATHRFGMSATYRADVTDIVKRYGGADYSVSNLFKCREIEINGASLVVIYDDKNDDNNADLALYEGNDSSQQLNFFADNDIHDVELQGDKVLIAGDFQAQNTRGRNRIARLNATAELDSTFEPLSGAAPGSGQLGTVRVAVSAADGKTLIGGDFSTFDDVSRRFLARLKADGTLDSSFLPNATDGPDGVVNCIVVTSDAIFIGGEFTHFGTQIRNGIARLETSGSLVQGFAPNVLFGAVRCLAVDANGKVVIGGSFTQVNGATRRHLARLNSDGSLDTGFLNGQDGPNQPVNSIVIEANGKILVGGDFQSFNFIANHSGLVRLELDGAIDSSWTPVTVSYTQGPMTVRKVALTGEKVLLCGRFDTIGANTRVGVARLNDDGSLDGTFTPASLPTLALVRDVQPYADQTYIAGNFIYASGYAVNRVARLNADGSVDSSFVSDSDWNTVIPLQPLPNATQGKLELHVSDGQHRVGEVAFDDPTIYVNGAEFLEPDAAGQSFIGYSVPSQHYKSPMAEEPGYFNRGLWDRTDPNATPFEIPPNTSSLRISSLCPLGCSSHEDYLSLVLAILQVPAGQAIQADAYTRIPMPAEHKPVANDDTFVVLRGIGTKVLPVLANDLAGGDTLLSVTSVTPAQHGTVETLLERSAILYAAKEGFVGSDTFSYTVSDLNGNTASAAVQVQVVGPAAEVLIDDQARFATLNLQPTEGRLSSRGSGQGADFYQFAGVAGDQITIDVKGPQVNGGIAGEPAFEAHTYLRDPLGQVVASGNHRNLGEATEIYKSATLTATSKLTGTYTVEVTSHAPGESGPYSVTLTRADNVTFIVNVDGKVMSNGGAIDLGIMTTGSRVTRVITVQNTGRKDIDLLQLVPGLLQGAGVSFNPGETTILRGGQMQTFTCTFEPNSGGQVSAGITVNARYYASDNTTVQKGFTFMAYVAPPGAEPTIAITEPKSGEEFLPGSTIMFRATARAPELDRRLNHVRFLAKFPGGSRHLTNVTADPYSSDPQEFAVTWSQVPEGVYTIMAEAYDRALDEQQSSYSRVGSTNITLVVLPKGRNFQPVAEPDTYRIVMNSGATLLNVLTNDSDLNGDSLKIIKIDPPNGDAQIASSGAALIFTPPQNAYGTEEFVYTISDGRGGQASALLRVQIVNSMVMITTDPSPNLEGELSLQGGHLDLTINVTAVTSEGAITKVACFVDDHLIGEKKSRPFSFPFSVSEAGFYTIKASALDDKNTTLMSEPMRISVSSPGTASPKAVIANIQPGQLVREGLFELRGTAKPPAVPQSFQYEVSLHLPDEDASIFAQTYTTPVNNSALSTLDLTTLRNGVYEVQLKVFNAGKSRTERVRFVLESQVKIGQFAFSEQDLVIPASPVPITIVRTYDSFNRSSSDFGTSWSLAINNMDIQLDEGREWQLKDPDIPGPEFPDDYFLVRAGGGRNISLTLPDGRRTTFRFMFKEGASDGDVPCFCYEGLWVSSPGVQAVLAARDSTRIQFLPWQDTIGPFWAAAGPETPMDNFDFSGYYLTNHDGTVYEILADDLGEHDLSPDFDSSILRMVHAYKDPKLRRIIGKDGAEIHIDHTAGFTMVDHYIDSASAQAQQPSRSVLIVRDPDHNNRITAIYDPASWEASIPNVTYEYYANGNLLKVRRLVDPTQPENPVYHDTTYVYSDVPAYQNFLTEIIDHRGVTVLKNTFEDGRWIASTDAAGNVTKIEHSIGLRRETVRDSEGNGTVHEYDARGNVIASINVLGERTTRTYDNDDNALTETDAVGNTMSYEYDGKGNRTRIRDPLDHQTLMDYNYLNQATLTIDARNNPSVSDYHDGEAGENRTGNLISTIDAAGNETQYTYDSRNRLDTITDALLNTTKYVYYSAGEADGNPGDLKSETVSTVAGVVLSERIYRYDANGNRVREEQVGSPPDENRVTQYEYDSQNRLTKTIQNPGPNQRVTRQTYNALGKVHEQFDPLNRRTRFFYDRRGNLVQTVHYGDENTQPTVTRTVYDSQNRVVYSQERCYTGINADLPDPATTGIATHNFYDALGRVIHSERLSWVKIIATYQNNDEICETEFDEIALPPPDAEHPTPNPFISSTDTEFDAAGRLFRTISQGVLTENEYDGAGRRIRSSIWNGRERIDSFYGYDENGNVRFFTNAVGVVTEYEYDKLNRTIFTRSDRYGLNILSQVGYDALGRRVAETNETDITQPPENAIVVTRSGYDALGRLIGVTNAYGSSEAIQTTYGYNHLGELTSQTNAENHVTSFSYNQFGQRIRRTLPNEQYEQFFYDLGGNRTIHTNFSGRITEFKYDALNRLLKKYDRGQESNPWVVFTYLPSGQRDTMTDGTGVTEYQYYASGRLWKKIVPYLAQEDRTLTYDYDERGSLKKISSSSYNVEYTRDGLDRLESVVDQNQRTTQYTYDRLGNLKTIKSSNVQNPNASVQSTYDYDSVNRLHTMQVVGGLTTDPQPLAGYTYGLGRTRKRKGVSETINGAATTVGYTYDLLDRLTAEEISQGPESTTISYQPNENFAGYDKVGNRRSREVAGNLAVPGVTQFNNQGFDANDRLNSSSYDANGNTTIEAVPAPATSPSIADEYDFENRLTKRSRVNVPGEADMIIELTYDGEGNRVKKHILDYSTQPVTATTITYLVDDLNPTGYAQVLREHAVSERSGAIAATETVLYCYGHDLLSQKRTAETFFPAGLSTIARWYGYDGHGSVRFLISEDNGTITDAYNY
ncbi:MAG TPA: Ig-like domain-containing protein, partial [Verrucomicrobiae bacterium]|nr:Ig-like domain-containing protein [Verrucomicrobiae bacterium]